MIPTLFFIALIIGVYIGVQYGKARLLQGPIETQYDPEELIPGLGICEKMDTLL